MPGAEKSAWTAPSRVQPSRSVAGPVTPGPDAPLDERPLTVAYYVHHHGVGHRTRFETIRGVSSDHLVGVSELDLTGDRDERDRWTSLTLPPDTEMGIPVDPAAGGVLHWAPLGPAAASRLAGLATWLTTIEPDGAVVDVSVEAALAIRLAGIPVVYVRQHGRRDDPAHTMVYRLAHRLLAPWPRELEDPRTPDWVVAKTSYAGFVVAPDHTNDVPAPAGVARHGAIGPDDIVVLWGTGGGVFETLTLERLARTTGRRVFAMGRTVHELDSGPSNVIHLGWVDEPGRLLSSRPTVVASAGNNTVALAAHHGCALVVVPMTRPFDEQRAHAGRLAAIKAVAVVDDPAAIHEWEPILSTAHERRDRLRQLASPHDGARRAADLIHDCFGPPR